MTAIKQPLSAQTRDLKLTLHDTHLGVWQDDAHDPSFYAVIFGGLIRQLRSRGWTVGADKAVKRTYPILSSSHRIARKGQLIASLKITGRVIAIDVWAETWAKENPNGHRYDFNKRDRLSYLDRLRLTIEECAIVAWLRTVAHVKEIRRPDIRIGAGYGQSTAIEFIARKYAEDWHTDHAVGRPVCRDARNSRAADGGMVEHGATVWFLDRKGRILRGAAHYNINNMWWIVAGPYALFNKASHEIYIALPDDLRRKRNHRARRCRLEAELAAAIERMHFSRAETLRKLIFGGQPAFMIWSRDKNAYYRPQYSGYTANAIRAGRYTREEAESEVRRVPHILELVTPDGDHVCFDEVTA